MQMPHDFLKSVPFDLFELHLLHLVADRGSLTRAGTAAGLSQSAITRQVQGVEERLGVPLFERTTRRLSVTPAGRFLLAETAHILGDVDASIRRMREEYAQAPKAIRAGISRSIGLAYLPGFFFTHRRRNPQVELTVSHEAGRAILEKVASDELDVGVVCAPDRLPRRLDVMHRFRDEFVLITPDDANPPSRRAPIRWKSWIASQSWLLIDGSSQTGLQLRAWMTRQHWEVRPAMELDNFDSIIQLVALGLGTSLVPQRALALYARKRGLRRHQTPRRFSRELVAVTRRTQAPPPHIAEFVAGIPF